jgi:phenylalanyl-tRNA synthetase beta chain
MKVSLSLIKWLGYPDLFELPINELVDKINGQLGALEEEPFYLGGLYEGAVVAKIVICEKHPDADKLNVCFIDDGGVVQDVPRSDEGLVQVVCGAPNARVGITVAWLPPGTTVPASVGKDPFVLEAREIRGEVSNGMLASASELAISEDHNGILEILAEDVGEELIKPGTPFKRLYGLDDYVLDIENKMFTHRPDLFGQLGVARELAGIQGKAFKSPDWYKLDAAIPAADSKELTVSLSNELTNEVPRFVLVPMAGVEVKPSPVWLQSWLSRLGLRSINNIVDITNFLMVTTGQPLHAYDYDKVKALSNGEGANFVVRNPRQGEKISLLNRKEIEPRAEAIMIATDQKAIGIGGVMGGTETEVDDNTKNIILEVASFDMYSVRRTSMFHGLFTDAVTRFNKGQSPLQNMAVAAQAAEYVSKLAGGRVAGALIDDSHVSGDSLYPPVQVSAGFINARLGLKLSVQEIKVLLENVEFEVEAGGDNLTVKAPFWRTDIELREDIVEEAGRLYGYDHLPLELPRRDLTPTRRDPLFDLKAKLRDRLSRAGANELLTYSFVHGDLIKKAGQDVDQAYQISNALSPDLQYYRLSLTPSLLEKVHPNIKAGYDNFSLFEIGKAHIIGQEQDGVPVEFERLALVLAANKKAAAQYGGAPYYQARQFVIELLDAFGLADKVEFEPLQAGDDQSTTYYEAGRAATIKVDGKIIGRLGEYKASVRSALKLPDYTAGFELGLGPLAEFKSGKGYVSLPRFPKVSQDLTLKVPTGLGYRELFDFISSEVAKIQPQNSLPSLTPVDIYQKQEDGEHKQVTLRLSIASHDRTLTDKEVAKLIDELAAAAKAKFNAEKV